jgi:hypothetical protein
MTACGRARSFTSVFRNRQTGGAVFAQMKSRTGLACALVLGAALLPVPAQASAKPSEPTISPCYRAQYRSDCSRVLASSRQRRAAAAVSSAQANAMQARASAAGQTNSTLSNPYLEQKVTIAEPAGSNATKIPAGGF